MRDFERTLCCVASVTIVLKPTVTILSITKNKDKQSMEAAVECLQKRSIGDVVKIITNKDLKRRKKYFKNGSFVQHSHGVKRWYD